MDVAYIEKAEHKKYINLLCNFTLLLLDNGIEKIEFSDSIDFYYLNELITVKGISDGRAIVVPNKIESEEHLLEFDYFISDELKSMYYEANRSLCKCTGLDKIEYHPQQDNQYDYVHGVVKDNVIIYKTDDTSEILEFMIKYWKNHPSIGRDV